MHVFFSKNNSYSTYLTIKRFVFSNYVLNKTHTLLHWKLKNRKADPSLYSFSSWQLNSNFNAFFMASFVNYRTYYKLIQETRVIRKLYLLCYTHFELLSILNFEFAKNELLILFLFKSIQYNSFTITIYFK